MLEFLLGVCVGIGLVLVVRAVLKIDVELKIKKVKE